MTDQTQQSPVERRSVLRAVGSLALVGAVAGCTTETAGDGGDGDGGDSGGNGGDGGSGSDGGDGGDGSNGGDGTDGGGGSADFDQEAVDEYLSETSNYDSVVDETGSSGVTVVVGAQANGGAFGFDPAAVQVSSGTTITWEWNGEGGQHNVVSEDGDFESELTSEEGFTFEQTFEETGVHRYFCSPHEGLGMKGVVVVV